MTKKAGISYAEILILIISTFAFAYIINSATEVSAQDEVAGLSCCEKTKDGKYCQFVEQSKCDAGFASSPTECKNAEFCKLGCCYSTNTGWCNGATAQRSCEGSGTKWTEDASCNLPECQRGCCVLGRNALFTTEQACKVKSSVLGFSTDFIPEIKNEVECLFLAEKDDQGACVYDTGGNNSCKILTRESCLTSGGTFYKNTYCSSPALATGCKAHDYSECSDNENHDGKSLYWFDSCGNREEAKEACSIFAGTICGSKGEGYGCKSIDCNIDGKIRKNGESWCVYDGTIGDGKDTVGSRHFRHICFMGEERVEPCQDYRNQICVQSDTDLGNGKVFSEAACRVNNWRSCLEYNTKEATDKDKLAEKCNENPDCLIKHVDATQGAVSDITVSSANCTGALCGFLNNFRSKRTKKNQFVFDICVPRYPPGLDISNEATGKSAESVCSFASQRCTVVEVKQIGGWKCKANCACREASFTEAMNDFCSSLGDCGAKANYIGEVSDEGYSITGSRAPKLSSTFLNTLKKYALAKPGQKPAEPGNLSFLLGSWATPGNPDYKENFGLNNALGVAGIGALVAYAATGAFEVAGIGFSAGALEVLGAAGNAIAAVGAVLSAASILSVAFGMNYKAALAIAGIGFAVAFTIAASQGSAALTAFMSAMPIVGLILLVIFLVLKFVFGLGKSRQKTVSFTCLPWQPPNGGADCSKCNGDPFKPCSPYRCKSLGLGCELINKGTDSELCIDNSPKDVSSPKISPMLGIITEGYEYFDIGDNGFKIGDSNKNCIPEFTPITFGIQTDKPAQCKISDDPLITYDEMEDYLSGSNLYLTNHTTVLNIPSPESLANEYNLTADEIKQIGEANFYVKCKSVSGRVNDASYAIKTCIKPGPDLTAPYVAKAIPDSGSYMAYGETEYDLDIWTNEPANCKWSSQDKDYELMENPMECYQSLEDSELYGWPCSAKLTGLDTDNKFYIRCQDLSENKNVMSESYPYELKRSESQLTIDEVRPINDQEIIAGAEPVTVDLEVATSGGAEAGKAECSYKFTETSGYIKFLETSSTIHKQVFTQIVRGSYKAYLQCEDIAGNVAENITEFKVTIDITGPKIVRAYYDGSLKIITDENSVCAYSLGDSRCKFDIENITEGSNAQLMSGEGQEHSADWQTNSAYYIKCKDEFGNQPGRCSMVIRPYNII